MIFQQYQELSQGNGLSNLNYQGFNEYVADETKIFLDSLRTVFRIKEQVSYQLKRDSLYKQITEKMGEDEFIKMRGKDYNENLANLYLTGLQQVKYMMLMTGLFKKLIRFLCLPDQNIGRAHFFAPYKQIGNLKIGTLLFNVW